MAPYVHTPPNLILHRTCIGGSHETIPSSQYLVMGCSSFSLLVLSLEKGAGSEYRLLGSPPYSSLKQIPGITRHSPYQFNRTSAHTQHGINTFPFSFDCEFLYKLQITVASIITPPVNNKRALSHSQRTVCL